MASLKTGERHLSLQFPPKTRHSSAEATGLGNNESVDIILHGVLLCPQGNMCGGHQVSAIKGARALASLTLKSFAWVDQPNTTRQHLAGPQLGVSKVASHGWPSVFPKGRVCVLWHGFRRTKAQGYLFWKIESALAIWTTETGLENNKMCTNKILLRSPSQIFRWAASTFHKMHMTWVSGIGPSLPSV